MLLVVSTWVGSLPQIVPPAQPPQATPTASPTGSAPTLPAASSVERRMYEALNAERVRQGLNPLAWSYELATAAALHSADMAAKDYLDHDGSDGSSPRDRAARQGYLVPPPGSGWMVIEAISALPSMDAALNWLLTDGQHRRVLLRTYFREVGIGYVAGGRYGNYWTLDFGCRANVLPVFASPSADGKSVALTLTNETCMPYGSGTEAMGSAADVMISVDRDFKNGAWEPFSDSKLVPRPRGSDLNVRLRDASGRLSAPVRVVLDGLQTTGAAEPAATVTTSPTSAPAATAAPTREPTATPTPKPSPTARPSPTPRPSPTASPTTAPTPEPTATADDEEPSP